MFSLRLTRQRSKMSFSRRLFCWICGAICLVKSTTEDLAYEPWTLWIKQHESRDAARGKSCRWQRDWKRQRQPGVTGTAEEKLTWPLTEGPSMFNQRTCTLRCINSTMHSWLGVTHYMLHKLHHLLLGQNHAATCFKRVTLIGKMSRLLRSDPPVKHVLFQAVRPGLLWLIKS